MDFGRASGMKWSAIAMLVFASSACHRFGGGGVPADAAMGGSSGSGGACAGSTCLPVAIARGQNSPNGLAVDAINVYWTTSDGNVMKAPRTGGHATILASGQDAPWGI